MIYEDTVYINYSREREGREDRERGERREERR
jgi:hypothetical protein